MEQASTSKCRISSKNRSKRNGVCIAIERGCEGLIIVQRLLVQSDAQVVGSSVQ